MINDEPRVRSAGEEFELLCSIPSDPHEGSLLEMRSIPEPIINPGDG